MEEEKRRKDVEHIILLSEQQKKDVYEEYLAFLEIEKNKGEGISKEVQVYLYLRVKEWGNKFKFIEGTERGKYSSGRKFTPFDVLSFFNSYEKTKTHTNIKLITFCSQEIDSYAKSYRILNSKYSNLSFEEGKQMIKVFEFKPDKI